MKQDEIIEMAIEAEFVSHGKPSDEESELFVCVDKDIYKFAKLVADKAIAELESQEPVAWQFMNGSNFRKRRPDDFVDLDSDGLPYWKPLYTTPPQRIWVGLTDEEIKTICSENGWDSSWQSLRFARAIEAKLKEKNS